MLDFIADMPVWFVIVCILLLLGIAYIQAWLSTKD